MKVGDQYYKEYDDGRADNIVPIDDPRLSPAQLEDRRRAVERVAFMNDHPLGAGAYGLVSLADLSVLDRDAALAGGGLIDAALAGAAPRAAAARRLAPSPQGRVASPSWQRPNVRYGDLNATGQASTRHSRLPCLARGQGQTGSLRRLVGKETATPTMRREGIFWRRASAAQVALRRATSLRSRIMELTRRRCGVSNRAWPGGYAQARS